jgi:membrane protease YdiL (CAAX protease family)
LQEFSKAMTQNLLKYLGVFIPVISIIIFLYHYKNPLLALVIYQLGMIMELILFRRQLRYKVKDGWDLFFGLASTVLTLVSFMIVFLLWDTIFIDMKLNEKMIIYNLNKPMIFLLFSTILILINPVIEELFWRDLLNIERFIALEDFGFAFYHGFVLILFFPWYLTLSIVGCLLIVSVGWKLITNKFKGLAIPVLMHILADCCIIGITYLKILK